MKKLVCGFLVLTAAVGSSSVFAQELEPDELRICERQLKSGNQAESYAGAWRLSGHYRAKGELKSAENILKNSVSLRDFERLPQAVALEKLHCILEMAHIKALQDDVSGALSLLNWAEQRKNEFQRSVSLMKYAEILLDLGEFERAEAYWKSGDELIGRNLGSNPDGAAIGEGAKGIDKSAAWRELKHKSDDLARELEFEQLKRKYGASYALYVKLRRCQFLLKKSFIPRCRKEAFAIVDEIAAADPQSLFAEAAKYVKGAILSARLTDESDRKQIREAKDYLEKFANGNPDGLYQGEALMELGRISLECEWNAKESEKYYKEALAHFQKARQKRDVLSMYAPLSDELKRRTAPTQKPTTLNEWKRIVYHEEDPLKLYSTANAPPWYADDKEKYCVVMLGMFQFERKEYDNALKTWEKLSELDSDIALLQSQRIPSILYRFRVACQTKKLVVSEALRNQMSKRHRLPMLWGEILLGLERFNEAKTIFTKIKAQANSKIDQVCILLAVGESTNLSMNRCPDRKEWLKLGEETFGKVYKLLDGSNTPEEHDVLQRYFCFLQQSSETVMDSVPLAREFIKKYSKKDPNYPWMLRAVLIYELSKKNLKEVKRIYKEIRSFKDTEEIQTQFTEKPYGYFEIYGYDPEQEKFIEKGRK